MKLFRVGKSKEELQAMSNEALRELRRSLWWRISHCGGTFDVELLHAQVRAELRARRQYQRPVAQGASLHES